MELFLHDVDELKCFWGDGVELNEKRWDKEADYESKSYKIWV